MAEQKRLLTSVRDIAGAFGGVARMAGWVSSTMSTVAGWIKANEIPNGWHYRIHLELTARGFEIDPAVFGVKAKVRA